MRILIDECLPKKLKVEFASHTTFTCYHESSMFHPKGLLFIQCASSIHPLNETIIKFVAERNQIPRNESLPKILNKLVSKNSISNACAASSEAIYKSHRNDIHHLNPGVDKIKDWHNFARRNFRNIATIEHNIFGYTKKGNTLYLNYPQYWDYGYASTSKPDYNLRTETFHGLAIVAIRGYILLQNSI